MKVEFDKSEMLFTLEAIKNMSLSLEEGNIMKTSYNLGILYEFLRARTNDCIAKEDEDDN